MAERWATDELPGVAWEKPPQNPAPDPPKVPADLRAQGIPGGTRIETLQPSPEYL